MARRIWGRYFRVAALVAVALVASVLATATQMVVTAGPASAAPGDITTVAGSFVAGPTPATSISLASFSLARFGNILYTSDSGACVVRRIDLATGLQSIYAGAGGCGNSGVGGPATAATIGLVTGLATTATGDLYISINAGRIQKVSAATGIITTVAGTGTWGYTGDGGPALSAQFNRPQGIAVDGAGNLYIADTSNNVVRRVDAVTRIITNFAGGGTSITEGDQATNTQLNAPYDVEITPSGNVAIAEGGGHIVRSVSLPGGTINSIAGNRIQASSGDGGPALAASINGPVALSYDGAGNLLIADYAGPSSVIRRVNASDATITTVAGIGSPGYSGDGGPATSAQLRSPSGVVAGTGGSFYIADAFNYRLRAVVGGTISTLAGNGYLSRSGDGGPATSAQLERATTPVADSAGNIYISDPSNYRVMKVTASTGLISVYAGGGVASPGDGGPATGAALAPGAMAIDTAGNLFIAEATRIRRVDAVTKVITTFAGTGTAGFSGDGGLATAAKFDDPTGLSFDRFGSMYLADMRNSRVRKITVGTNIITTVAGGGPGGLGDGLVATQARLAFPKSTATDSSGNLFIADWTNQGDARIRKVNAATQIISTISGQGANQAGDGLLAVDASLLFPNSVLTDAAGNLFIADSGHGRVRRIDTNGVINTVAGGGTGGLGDGGPARAARLGSIGGLGWDPNGNLLLGDGNRLVRRVTAPFTVGGGGLRPIDPFRALDSRTTVGGWNSPLAAGAPRPLAVTGAGGIPSTASVVILNVTVTAGTNDSFLTVFPTGGFVPTASNLNFAAGQTLPNLVTVKVGAGGTISMANALGSVDVVADLVGYFDDGSPGGDLFNGVTPARLLDSRGAVGGWSGKLPSGDPAARPLQVRGRGGVSNTATAVVLNVTVTDATTGSYLQVWPTGSPRPNSSNLNFAAGQTIPNLVTVKVGAGGQVSFYNELGATHVVADVVGYFDPVGGSRFHPLPGPTRALDSRIFLGVPGSWAEGMSRSFNVANNTGFLGATGIIMNTTVTNATANSLVKVYPQGPIPPNSNLNFAAGQTIANLAMTGLPANGYVELYNELGTVDIIGDVVGYYGPG